MKRYELICVVSNGSVEPPDAATQCIAVGDYTAVLSSAPRKAIHFPVSRKDALKTAVKRQAIFESLMSEGAVLVAKPQQWLSLMQVSHFLAANNGLFADLCAWLTGKSQFQITVKWDASKVLSHFREAPELADLFKSGATTGKALAISVARLNKRLSTQIHHLLEPVVMDMIALPKTEEMLSNTVVLIPNAEETRLDRCVETIDAIWPEGFTIRQIGPSAAGSFALLDLAWVSATDIRAAHDKLSLRIGASAEDQRAAKRRVLMRSQSSVDEIANAARIVACTVPSGEEGFHIASVLSEEKGLSDIKLGAVA